MLQTFYAEHPIKLDYCDFRVSSVENWYTNDSVEGVTKQELQYFTITYNRYCSANFTETGTMVAFIARQRIVCSSSERFIDGECVAGTCVFDTMNRVSQQTGGAQ